MTKKITENELSDSFEIIAIITKEFPEIDGKKDKFQLLTKGYERLKYFDFLKVLKMNTVFSINNNYDIKYEKDQSISVRKINKSINIYSDSKPLIQVNAIVGKNGSGKSTISEILYLMLYNLAVEKKIIKDEKQNLITAFKGFLNSYLIIKLGTEIICIDFEILDFFDYEASQKKESKKVRFIKSYCQEGDINLIDLLQPNIEDFDLKNLFYMISLNYSLYGLNELNMGDWIKHIFHKNDMYDTPIVINPYREKGNIDVNTEVTQNNARSISNLSKRNNDLSKTTLSPDYKFNHLNVFYHKKKRKKAHVPEVLMKFIEQNLTQKVSQPIVENNINFKSIYNPFNFFDSTESSAINDELSFESKLFSNIISTPFGDNELEVQKLASILLENSKEAFEIIHRDFFNISNQTELYEIIKNLNLNHNKETGEDIIIDLFSYFICKLYRIGIHYPKEFGSLINDKKTGLNNKVEEFKEALLGVLTNKSHVCFKLKRVYYFINYSRGKDSINFVIDDRYNDQNIVAWTLENLKYEDIKYKYSTENFNISLIKESYIDKINSHFTLVNDVSWRIPPPIFETKLIVESAHEKSKNEDLSNLSSGETQFIYALQTILYHIININSNDKYKNIVLLLDEIELYHHPDYQRVFLSTLIKQINELNLKIESIQIILLTHSPFILSDISSSNILRLKEGNPEKIEEQTFGANIHDLLANDFFLDKGFMGEFAKQKINNVIDSMRIKKILDEKEKKEQKLLTDEQKLQYIRTIKGFEHLKKLDILSQKVCKQIISVVGEPMLYMSLMEIYVETFNDSKNDFIDEQIQKLIDLKKK